MISTERDLTFGVRDEAVVLGHDCEFADMSNPTGEIYGVIYYVSAFNSRGDRWNHDHAFDDKDKANAFCAKVEDAHFGGIMMDEEHWFSTQPVYGSEAYQKGGWEEELILLERRGDL